MGRWRKSAILKYSGPTPKIIFLGVATLLIALFLKGLELAISKFLITLDLGNAVDFSFYYYMLSVIAFILIIIAVVERVTRSDKRHIKVLVKKRLCAYSKGNPLHLKDGEQEPRIDVAEMDRGFKIRIECPSALFEAVSNLESVISDSLRKKYGDYAVVYKEEDVAGRYVDYYIADVVSDFKKQSIYRCIEDIPCEDDTRLYIRDDVYIDFSRTLNSSTLFVGGTRSGKTTAATSTILLPTLLKGRDAYGSRVVIVDPKSAEFSQCSYVLSPDLNGDVEHILKEIKEFDQTRINRQQIINAEGKKRGKAAKWYDIGMKPSILFIDEWVALQDLFPKKASKEKPEYCLSVFQGLIRRIATQGASAGCFLIISIAQASVGVGGLESVVNNACGIRVLFKPKKEEAAFIWDSKQLDALKEWGFGPGDAWFSIDDGINNHVSFVKFPKLDECFDEYKALSDLMKEYYED